MKIRKTAVVIMTVIIGVLTGSDNEMNVKTVRAERSVFSSVETYSGVIKHYKEANLGAVNAGRIEKIYFNEGDKVNKGDLVAVLSDENLTRAKIDYVTKQKDFNRTERLYQKGSVPEQTYDHVKAVYEASEEQYYMYKKNTEITAPFSGIITEYLMNEGETYLLINPGLSYGYSHANGIVRLINIDKVYAVLQIGEKDIPSLFNGQEVRIGTEIYPGTVFNGKIERISEMLDVSTHTTEVKVLLDNPGYKLKPGMFCNAEITLQTKSGVLIPRNAVIKETGSEGNYVYVVKDGLAEKRTVGIISYENDKVSVEGLNEDEMIVTAGKNKISGGSKVNIVNP